jgi:hypothetical protein
VSILLLALLVLAQPATAQPGSAPQPPFGPAALDAMLAPIALYPDPLLSQVLMAATYPREVDDAARWLREHPGLSGDAAVRSADGWDWDPSVRSLLAFPQVLMTLADYPSWTDDLGQAFLAQRENMMDSIQQLRRRALSTGALRSNESILVTDNGYAITIDPVTPQAVYVPYYDPGVAYGAWWWPDQRPMSWPRWPGYYAPSAYDPYLSWGPAIALSAGFFFGNFAWSQHEVRIVDVHPYYYPRTVVDQRSVSGHPVTSPRPPAPGIWQHDAQRRQSDYPRNFNPASRNGQPPEPRRRPIQVVPYPPQSAPHLPQATQRPPQLVAPSPQVAPRVNGNRDLPGRSTPPSDRTAPGPAQRAPGHQDTHRSERRSDAHIPSRRPPSTALAGGARLHQPVAPRA